MAFNKKSLLAINELATRSFPVLYVIFHLGMVTVMVGEKDCSETNMQSFFAYFFTLAIIVGVTEFYVSWKNAAGRILWPIIVCNTLSSVAYFAGIALQRAKPFKCVNEDLVYRVGPALTWATFGLNLGYAYYLIVHCTRPEFLNEFVSLAKASDVEAVPGEVAAGSTTFAVEYGNLEIMTRALSRDIRRKFPIVELILYNSFLIVFFDNECATSFSPVGYVVMVCLFLLVKFSRRWAQAWNVAVIQYVRPQERTVYATLEALQATALFLALIFNRGRVIKCFSPDASYTVSVPLLLFALSWGVASSYLLLRRFTYAQLIDYTNLFETKNA